MKYNQRELKRFFDGELTEEEAKSVFDWINSSEGEKEMSKMVDESWEKETKDILPNQKKSAANENQLIVNPDPLNPKPLPKKPKQIRIWFAVAASVTLLIAFGFALLSIKGTVKETDTTAVAVQLPIFKSTERGQRKLVILPDGSRVTLNASSKIEYGQDFATNRTLHLTGEAFFEVAKDPEHPFSVVSDALTTTALGTSFNIRAYGQNTPIQVSLATGKVKVADNTSASEPIFVEPGEGVSFNPMMPKMKKSKVDLRGAMSWQQGILHFDRVPFDAVVAELERWYGVEFEVAKNSSLPTYKCSGTFGPNEYLSNVLQALSHSVEFEYQIKDKTVTIKLSNNKPMKHPESAS